MLAVLQQETGIYNGLPRKMTPCTICYLRNLALKNKAKYFWLGTRIICGKWCLSLMNIGITFSGQMKPKYICLDQMMWTWQGLPQWLHSADPETWRWECADMGLHEYKRCRGDGIYRWHTECKFVDPNTEWKDDPQVVQHDNDPKRTEKITAEQIEQPLCTRGWWNPIKLSETKLNQTKWAANR